MGQTVTRPISGRLRRWALWSSSPRLALLVTAVTLVAAALSVDGFLGGSRLTGGWRSGQLLTWLVLLACAAVCVEAVHQVGQPAGVSKDLLSAWTLPVALLLPPVYSLLIPIPLALLRQFRVARTRVHRRVYSAAAIGLANWTVSVLFHRGEPWAQGLVDGGVRVDRSAVVLLALCVAVVGCALNVALIGLAVRLAAPGTTWRELVADREQRVLDAGEICLGVVVTGCWFVTPPLVLVMLLPVLLVQRSLAHAQLRAAARTDAKTGLLNAKAWQAEAEREIVRAHRERQPLAVLIADIDHFKRFNDAYGHLAGDVALMAAVKALTGGLRTYDQLGRFGGEEFTAVLPRTGFDEAARIAERLRRAVAAFPVDLDDTSVELSVSIGVAVLGEHGHDLTDLLTAADHALYRAKHSGRNRVAIAR